jgi:ribosomal protein L37AE/L43A
MVAAKKKQARIIAESNLAESIKTDTELSALNAALIKEYKIYNETCAQLGRYYAELHQSNPEPIFSDMVAQIHGAKDNIKILKKAIKLKKDPDMSLCPECGVQTACGAAFCTNCGAKLAESAKQQDAVCPACKSKISAGAFYCTHCGNKLTNQSAASH